MDTTKNVPSGQTLQQCPNCYGINKSAVCATCGGKGFIPVQTTIVEEPTETKVYNKKYIPYSEKGHDIGSLLEEIIRTLQSIGEKVDKLGTLVRR